VICRRGAAGASRSCVGASAGMPVPAAATGAVVYSGLNEDLAESGCACCLVDCFCEDLYNLGKSGMSADDSTFALPSAP